METKERRILNEKAHQKLLILKLGTSLVTSKIIKVLINKIKIPRVNIVIGNVRIIKRGRIKILTKPKTIATIIADPKSLTLIPGSIWAQIKTVKLFISRLIIILI